jgi:hypothetical protein
MDYSNAVEGNGFKQPDLYAKVRVYLNKMKLFIMKN